MQITDISQTICVVLESHGLEWDQIERRDLEMWLSNWKEIVTSQKKIKKEAIVKAVNTIVLSVILLV